MTLFLTKLVASGRRRIHIAHGEATRPLCGGGHGARSVQWQTEIGPCDCAACAKIALGQKAQISAPPPPEFFLTQFRNN